MNHYGILLVDDEEEVRSAILRKIDWAALGFDRSATRKTARTPWKRSSS